MITERIHGEEYKHKVADIEGYVDPTTVITAHKAEADAHTAANITNVPAGDIAAVTVQAAINELDTEKVSKAGSLTQITTRNHNDLQNLDAGSAHPSASIDNTSTSYGRGLATTDTTVQKVADRVNQNGTPQFVTDKTKCSLLLDFKGTLADRSRAINPIGSDAANKWTDNFVNDSTTKASATNISCTFKQFDEDEGKFGSGVAVEESRTNLFAYSEDLTISPWYCSGAVTLDRILPDGRKLFKVTATTNGTLELWQGKTLNGNIHCISFYIYNPNNISIVGGQLDVNHLISNNGNTRLERINASYAFASVWSAFGVRITGATVGQYFYISSPQVEAGAFPTSYIATGATAVTRPAGNLKYDNSSLQVFNPNKYTFNTWFNFSTTMNNPLVFHNIEGTYTRFNEMIFDFGNSALLYTIRYNGFPDIQLPIVGLSPTTFRNKWNMITVTMDGIHTKIYINGYLVVTSADLSSYKFEPLANLAFKLYNHHSNTAIFNYALSADEISQIYNSGLEGKPIAITNPENIIPVGQSLHDTNFITFTSGWGISSTYPNKPTLSNHDGVAMLRGIVEFAGVVNSDVTLFTLPVGARPSLPDTYYNSFIVSSRDSGAPSARILRVYGNGEIKLMAQGATITNPAISLDGISFINGK